MTSCSANHPRCTGGTAITTIAVPVSTTVCPVTFDTATETRTVSTCGYGAACSNGPYVTTGTIGVSTTVCPITETTSPSTLYTTQSYTVTSCHPEKHQCTVGHVATTVYPTGTTCISQWTTSEAIPTYTDPAGNNTTSVVVETSSTAVYELPTSTESASTSVSTPYYLNSYGYNVYQAAAVDGSSATSTTNLVLLTSAAGRVASGIELITEAFAVMALFL
ncbi:hypothetical protein AUP68_00460 [Ilyonectria robusta]